MSLEKEFNEVVFKLKLENYKNFISNFVTKIVKEPPTSNVFEKAHNAFCFFKKANMLDELNSIREV